LKGFEALCDPIFNASLMEVWLANKSTKKPEKKYEYHIIPLALMSIFIHYLNQNHY